MNSETSKLKMLRHKRQEARQQFYIAQERCIQANLAYREQLRVWKEHKAAKRALQSQQVEE